MRVDAVKKGTAYMNTWMYVIREFEDAIDDCSTSSIDNNYDAAHAWDEGVAFYAGSLEGTEGAGSGKMIAALADKRCQNFGTCGASGSATSGIAKANIDFFALSAEARDYLYSGQCSLVRPVLTEVIKKMTIPLIQGTYRYAYKVGANGPGGSNNAAHGSNTLLKENAEGAIFAHAVLPLVHAVSPSAATTIYNNMKVGEFSPDRAAVKAAFESVLPGLGISCAEIGALNVAGGLATASDAFGVACTDLPEMSCGQGTAPNSANTCEIQCASSGRRMEEVDDDAMAIEQPQDELPNITRETLSDFTAAHPEFAQIAAKNPALLQYMHKFGEQLLGSRRSHFKAIERRQN